MNVEIRFERDEDFRDLIEIHCDAFQRRDEGELVEKLHQNSQYDRKFSFVALVDGQIVGHLLFTPLLIRYLSTSTNVSSFALAPISIRTDFQRKGIGTRLIEFALDELRSRNVQTIVVLGHKTFYPKFGFRPAKNFQIRGPFQLADEDCLMILELTKNVLPVDRGEGFLEYLPEFGL